MPVSREAGEAVAFIIIHTIREGAGPRYEAWLTEILGEVRRSPGYLGRDIFRPAHGGRRYTSVVRFDSRENLERWSASPVRRAFIDEVSPLLEEGDRHEIRTGIDFWFTPDGGPPPKRWKQFVLTLSAVYPLTLILPRALDLVPWPPGLAAARGFAVAASLTALLTFVIMPRYTRLVRRWLYEE